MYRLICISLCALGCGSAPARPMPAELDPASDGAADVPYVAPDNPLTRDVGDVDDGQPGADRPAHEHHHEPAGPGGQPPDAEIPSAPPPEESK